jgi:hypothetical protein
MNVPSHVRDPRYSAATNIWGVGLMMLILMEHPLRQELKWVSELTVYRSK